MDNYESGFEDSDGFEAISLAVSDEGIEVHDAFGEIPGEVNELSVEGMLEGLEAEFMFRSMNEHMATLALLGDLSHSDVLMYYCIVMDTLALHDEEEEEQPKVLKPEEYIEEKESIKEKAIELTFECPRHRIIQLKELLTYFKNREFKILSNTFYMDGSDFLIFLTLKSTVGYNLRIKIVLKCDDESEAEELKKSFLKLRVGEEAEGENDE